MYSTHVHVCNAHAAFEKVVHYRGQEYLTQLVDTAGQVILVIVQLKLIYNNYMYMHVE